MKKLPPKCPYCNKFLTKVLENDYRIYVFEPKSGTYKEDDVAGYIKMYCPNLRPTSETSSRKACATTISKYIIL